MWYARLICNVLAIHLAAEPAQLAAEPAAARCVRGEPGACFSCGELAWQRSQLATQQARLNAGLDPQEPGPLPDLRARIDLRNGFLGIVDEGLMCLTKALSADSLNDKPRVMMSQLWRVRAKMEDDIAGYDHDMAQADEWLLQSAEPIRLGVEYQSANLLKAAEPKYPSLAKHARIQGTVRLDVTIGKDGRVFNVQLLQGHPLLTPAAIAAAKGEVYQPLFVRGRAVEVITEVLIEFTLTN